VAPQLAHSRAYARLIEPPHGPFLDLGSGGGLPGLLLAVEWPTATGTLLDSNQRRTHFLTEAVAALGLDERLHVVTARAEEAARDPELRNAFDLVAARSFAAPAVTAECAVGFLQAGGRLAVSEPPDGGSSERWPAAGLDRLGLEEPEIRHGDGVSVALLTLLEVAGERWPRRTGIPAKRPLW
jgi:16S rRNA (guanine527-N7)-methyltransferase